jgi:cell wall-associated NlpC family hydrolase
VPEPSLGDVPGLADLLKNPSDIPVSLAPAPTHPLGEASADSLGLGEQTFDNPNAYTDALTFDNAQGFQDPMSDLHIGSLDKFGVKQNQDGSFTSLNAPQGARGAVIAAARKMLGTPYVWGGSSQSGVDCSGLIQLIFGQQGIKMPRISADQARHGRRVAIDKLQPGDLVAWNNSSRNVGADHIALYIGNGMIIEAPRPGRNVQVSHIYDTNEAWGVSLDY